MVGLEGILQIIEWLGWKGPYGYKAIESQYGWVGRDLMDRRAIESLG